MWTARIEVQAAEMRTEQARVRRGRQRKRICASCDSGVGVGLDQCSRCRRSKLDPAARIADVPVALRIRICITCRDPFEAFSGWHPKLSYCCRICSAKGQALRNLNSQDWDACRMLADLDYFGPSPLPVSHWHQIERLAVG